MPNFVAPLAQSPSLTPLILSNDFITALGLLTLWTPSNHLFLLSAFFFSALQGSFNTSRTHFKNQHNGLYPELEKCEKNPRDETHSDGSSSKPSGLPMEIQPITKYFLWLKSSPLNPTLGRTHCNVKPQRAALCSKALISSVIPRWLSEVCYPEDGRAPNKSRSLNVWICLFLLSGQKSVSCAELSSTEQLKALVWTWLTSLSLWLWWDAWPGC